MLLLLSAFISGAETALTTASRVKLHGLAERGSRGAADALLLTEDQERLLGAFLLGNTLVVILAVALATCVLHRLLEGGAVLAATLATTALVLVFAQLMPRAYAAIDPEAAAAQVARPIRLLALLLAPLTALLQGLARGILRLFGVRTDPRPNSTPRRRRSPAPSPWAIPKAWSRKRTATGCSGPSTSGTARSRR